MGERLWIGRRAWRVTLVVGLSCLGCGDRAVPAPGGGPARVQLRLQPGGAARRVEQRTVLRADAQDRWDVLAELVIETSDRERAVRARPRSEGGGGGSEASPPPAIERLQRVTKLSVEHNGVPMPLEPGELRLKERRSPRFLRMRPAAIELPPAAPVADGGVTSTDARRGRARLHARARQLSTMLDLARQLQFPEGSVAVGESWSPPAHELSVPGLGIVKLRTAYVLRAVHGKGRGRIAHIDATLDLRGRPRAPYDTLTLTGTGSGYARFQVRLTDGQLSASDTRITFLHELATRAGEILAQRELFLWSVGRELPDEGQPASELSLPPLPQPSEPGPACDDQLAVLSAFREALPGWGVRQLAAAASGVLPPKAPGARIESAGPVLVMRPPPPVTRSSSKAARRHEKRRTAISGAPDKPLVLLAGRAEGPTSIALDYSELRGALSGLSTAHVYVLADRRTPLAQVKRLRAALPAGLTPLLVTRAGRPAIRPPRWVRRALALTTSSPPLARRHRQLTRLLHGQLSLCTGAQDALHARARDPDRDLAELIAAVTECGCRRLSVPGLVASLAASYGGVELRAAPWSALQTAGVETLGQALPELSTNSRERRVTDR